MTTAVRSATHVRSPGRGDWKETLGRVGLVGRGVLYGAIGLLAVQLALGNAADASQAGAIEWVGSQPLGKVLLVALTISLFALAAWRFLDAVLGDPVEGSEPKDRARYAVGGAIYLRWWDKYVEDGLGSWGVAEVSRRTGGAYRLILGDLDFRPFAGSLSFDSAVAVTDTAVNRARAAPLPILNARATGCRLSGVGVLGLLLQNHFEARHMGCASVTASVQLLLVSAAVADAPDTDSKRAPGERPAPPLGISHFRIADVAFPTLVFSLRRPIPRGQSYLSLERARLRAELMEYDPTAPLGQRAGSSKGVRLDASGFLLRPDTVSEFAIGYGDK